MNLDELLELNFDIRDKPNNYLAKTKATKESKVIVKNETNNVSISPVLKNTKTETTDDILNSVVEICKKITSIDELKKQIACFDKLAITKTATNVVFADGNQDSGIMVIGEAPGANEDEQGIPFCGMSGRLLDQIFRSINLSREQNIYITNSIYWRPPGNRRPTEQETSVCKPFLLKHIELFKPKLIILVGSTAVKALLNIDEPISKLRKREFRYHCSSNDLDIPVKIIFHPSYLLRQPKQKKNSWFDMIEIKRKYLSN